MKFLNNKKSNKRKRSFASHHFRCKTGVGFTLIELLIAVAIFIIVISVIFSLFLSALKGQRKAIASQNVQDNARFLLSFIAKEIRMSEIMGNPTNPVSMLTIKRPDGNIIVYEFDYIRGNILRKDSSGYSAPLNSEEVSIIGRFYVTGIGSDDGQQPRVTIIMKVETDDSDRAEINTQTTISLRNLEL